MNYEEYMHDKIYKHQHIISGESDCCGAGVYEDIMICSDCKDHCDYAPNLCGYCGDREVEEDNQFCSDACWRGYEAETFKEKF